MTLYDGNAYNRYTFKTKRERVRRLYLAYNAPEKFWKYISFYHTSERQQTTWDRSVYFGRSQ